VLSKDNTPYRLKYFCEIVIHIARLVIEHRHRWTTMSSNKCYLFVLEGGFSQMGKGGGNQGTGAGGGNSHGNGGGNGGTSGTRGK
jgi:hypothetical protein